MTTLEIYPAALPTVGNEAGELRAFYRLEKAATATYVKALLSGSLRPFAGILESCHASHRYRAELLAARIRGLGGAVPKSPGSWGALVPLFEQAAATVSARMAISLLEQHEGHCLSDYRVAPETLHPNTRLFLRDHLLPREIGSHQSMSNLKHSLG